MSPITLRKISAQIFTIGADEAAAEAFASLFRTMGWHLNNYSSVDGFLDQLAPDMAGCLIADLIMPGMGGMDLLGSLKKRKSCINVIIISDHGTIELAVQAMKMGASDFLTNPYTDQKLINGVQVAMRKSVECASEYRSRSHSEQLLDTLTVRERQVFELVISECSNRTISEKLAISEKTVEAHRGSLMRKLGVSGPIGLVKSAYRCGLLEHFR